MNISARFKAAALSSVLLLPCAASFGAIRPSVSRKAWLPHMTATSPSVPTTKAVPPGWVGGFEESNPAFAYPNPDMASIPVCDNMDNVRKLDRQQKVLWPQFSWLVEEDDPNTRIYQMFAPDISRLGYDEEGRVWSIICPQQGFGTDTLGTLNVEVTVTGQRGWCNEPAHTVYADMSVTGKLWFSPPGMNSTLLTLLEAGLNHANFPFSKENAIEVTTHKPGNSAEPLFQLLNGTDTSFRQPPFTQHLDEAYGVGHLQVQIGPIVKTNKPQIDGFNQMILDIFNFASGNILKEKSTLSWNVWFDKPELVNRWEWRTHALKWRYSIDVNHAPPDGEGTDPQYYDGTPFNALDVATAKDGDGDDERKLIKGFVKEHLSHLDKDYIKKIEGEIGRKILD